MLSVFGCFMIKMWCNLDQPIILDNCQVSHVRFSSVKYLAKNDPVINHLQYEYICTVFQYYTIVVVPECTVNCPDVCTVLCHRVQFCTRPYGVDTLH